MYKEIGGELWGINDTMRYPIGPRYTTNIQEGEKTPLPLHALGVGGRGCPTTTTAISMWGKSYGQKLKLCADGNMSANPVMSITGTSGTAIL